jgi:gluconolactonase
MRFVSALYVLCILSGIAAAADIPAPTGEAIVPADSRLELLFTRTAPVTGGLTEGPAVAPDGSIYFSDIPFGKDKGMILRFDPKTRKTTVFKDDSGKSNGLKFDARGFLIACEGADGGGRRLARHDVKTGKSETIVDSFDGKRFNSPNDLAIDLKDRIYFTDPRYVGDEPRELKQQAVYRLDTDGTIVEVTHDCEKPNGIVLSPDQKVMYLVDHNNGTDKIDPKAPPSKKGAMKVYAFDLGDDGLVKKGAQRRTLYDWGTEDGSDGMTVDSKGNVYMVSRSAKRPGVIVTDPKGKELAFIPTADDQSGVKEPAGIPSNCAFGLGADARTLYITVDKSLYRIKLKIDGYHIPFESK